MYFGLYSNLGFTALNESKILPVAQFTGLNCFQERNDSEGIIGQTPYSSQDYIPPTDVNKNKWYTTKKGERKGRGEWKKAMRNNNENNQQHACQSRTDVYCNLVIVRMAFF